MCTSYAVNRFFIRLMLTIKKNTATAIIQSVLMSSSIGKLNPRIRSTRFETTSRTILTTLVNGKTANDASCTARGRDGEFKGKKVSLRKNIGVKKRNVGKLKKSMFGAAAVKHMAMEENISPPKNAIGITSKKRGVEIKPKTEITANTIAALMVARVAPQRRSPATTSSTLTGVAIMASKVFW